MSLMMAMMFQEVLLERRLVPFIVTSATIALQVVMKTHRSR